MSNFLLCTSKQTKFPFHFSHLFISHFSNHFFLQIGMFRCRSYKHFNKLILLWSLLDKLLRVPMSTSWYFTLLVREVHSEISPSSQFPFHAEKFPANGPLCWQIVICGIGSKLHAVSHKEICLFSSLYFSTNYFNDVKQHSPSDPIYLVISNDNILRKWFN